MDASTIDAELAAELARYRYDPLGFAQFAFPWGDPAGPLPSFVGPQQWQAEIQLAIKVQMAAPRHKAQFATASGKGIGKSALLSQIALWGLSTLEDSRVRITAGTEPQLRNTTLPELAKWYNMLICKHWFKAPATSIYSIDPSHEKTWRLEAMPWNSSNPEAFAGLHNFGKRIVFIFDEASQIADSIWDTTDGIMTDADTEVLWFAAGNPTRGVGRFFRCFGDLRHRWHHRQIDSRDVQITDKVDIAEKIADYGEDSDYARMMIRGMFPRRSSLQFIDSDVVAEARKRDAQCHLTDALILGVDVARFGDDMTVLAFRKGLDARTVPWLKLRNADTQQIAGAITEAVAKFGVDAVFVDAGGPGAGVVDRLRAMGIPHFAINFGGGADRSQMVIDATRYGNKRSEMWGYMREWLKGGAIPDNTEMETDLTGVWYTFRDGKNGSDIVLEKKEHMKARGLASPDNGDALALTFAYPVLPRSFAGGPHAVGRQIRQAQMEYNPWGGQDAAD